MMPRCVTAPARQRLLPMGAVCFLLWSGCGTTPEPTSEGTTKAAQPAAPAAAARPTPQESMSRLQREMAAGKQPGSPEPPPPPRDAPPREAPRSQAPAVAKEAGPCVPVQKPSWTDRQGKLQGLGISTAGQREADADARADLVKQFEVTVTGKDTTTQVETTEQGFRYSVASEVSESVNLAMTGLSITERFVDRCSGAYYAQAAVDRQQAVDAWLHDLDEQVRKSDELKSQAQGLESGGYVFRAMLTWHRLMEAQDLGAQLKRRVSFLNPDALKTAPNPGSAVSTQARLESLLASVSLRKEGGEGQVAKLARPLDQPLAARMVVSLPGGEVAVPGVALGFMFESGQGTVEPRAVTDAQGKAAVTVSRVEPGSAAEVTAKLALDQLPPEFPARLRAQIEQRFSREVLRYRLTPPRMVSAATPFDEAVGRLAQGLAERMNDSFGVIGVVKDFVENRSKRRLSVSTRIESAMAGHLVQLNALRIRQSVEGMRALKPEAESKDAGPVAAVFGVYELDPSGALWIEAKVVRLKDREMEATMPATIPSAALPDEDLRELRSKGPAAAPSSVVPTPAPSQSVGKWVEDLWDQRNSEGFKTEIEPLRSSYRVGETAEFRFRTNQDCYLTVLSIGPSGTMTMLLPNFERPTPNMTLVRADMGWITFPSADDGFQFTINPPLGTERVKAICTKTPTKLFENVDLKKGLLQLSEQDRLKLRDIGVSTKAQRPEDWSTTQTQVITLDKGQSETRGMRGLRGLGEPR